MKINYRVKGNTNIGKWAKTPFINKNKTHCDMCKARLWVTPGGNLYCDNEHDIKVVAN